MASLSSRVEDAGARAQPARDTTEPRAAGTSDATFYTVSDARFFVGTAALVNSLRLTGHDDEIVVLDRGLEPEQRRLLAGQVTFAEIDADVSPMLCKPYPHLLGAKGTIVVLDSDIIVTRSLRHITELSRSGKICVYPDVLEGRTRWFEEWVDIFELNAPLRRQTFMGSGFVAFSTQYWPDFLERWWQACARHPRPHDVALRHALSTGLPDQDALNALLMSELPSDAVAELPEYELPLPPRLLRTEVFDEQSLVCRFQGHDVTMLHYSGSPKPWERSAWMRVCRDAYVRLLPRVLFGRDVALRLPGTDVAYWLRPTRRGAALLRGLDAIQRTARVLARRLPSNAQIRLRTWRDLVALRRTRARGEP